jgi:hypothetical protein
MVAMKSLVIGSSSHRDAAIHRAADCMLSGGHSLATNIECEIKFARVFTTRQTSVFFVSNLVSVQVLPHTKGHQRSSEERDRRCSCAQKQGDEAMLGTLAAVLIVLWLLGFFAFHVTTAFVHVALIVGIILLVMHFLRRSASV